MHRASLIIIVVVVVLASGLFITPKVILHIAKRRATKEHTNARQVLNSVPHASRMKMAPAADYTNTVWVDVAGCQFGFPADRFTRDASPKRENTVLHHSRYRVLILPGADGKTFDPVMQELNLTNFYDFILSVFNATERDIARQPNMDALQRHLVLLNAKSMMSPGGFEDSCIEFDRGDVKGFIIGDPLRSKNLYVLVYVESRRQFVDLSVIEEAQFQISELEELIASLKVKSNKSAAASLCFSAQCWTAIGTPPSPSHSVRRRWPLSLAVRRK